jgi:hypothetical protein
LSLLFAVVVMTWELPDPAQKPRGGENQLHALIKPTVAPTPTASVGPTIAPPRAEGADGASPPERCVLTGTASSDGISCPKGFTIAGDTAGLYPGKTVQLPLTLANPNSEDIRVRTIAVSVAGASDSSCSIVNLRTSSYAGPGFVVAAGASRTIFLPIAMSREAPDACQDVTFTLVYSGKAEVA